MKCDRCSYSRSESKQIRVLPPCSMYVKQVFCEVITVSPVVVCAQESVQTTDVRRTISSSPSEADSDDGGADTRQ